MEYFGVILWVISGQAFLTAKPALPPSEKCTRIREESPSQNSGLSWPACKSGWSLLHRTKRCFPPAPAAEWHSRQVSYSHRRWTYQTQVLSALQPQQGAGCLLVGCFLHLSIRDVPGLLSNLFILGFRMEKLKWNTAAGFSIFFSHFFPICPLCTSWNARSLANTFLHSVPPVSMSYSLVTNHSGYKNFSNSQVCIKATNIHIFYNVKYSSKYWKCLSIYYLFFPGPYRSTWRNDWRSQLHKIDCMHEDRPNAAVH